jgi:hypothetical protein
MPVRHLVEERACTVLAVFSEGSETGWGIWERIE